MNQLQEIAARAQAYRFFSQIFLSGIQPDHLPLVGAIPEFSGLPPIDMENTAAAHYQLFGMNVFPFETMFPDTSQLLGGDITEQVAQTYRETGYAPPSTENADHLGVELDLLAFLSGAEHDAHEDNAQSEIHRMRTLQRHFMDTHVLRWLPAVVMALQQQGDSLFARVSDLTLQLLLEHRRTLDDVLLPNSSSFTPPAIPPLLEDEATGIKEIAAHLLTHVYTGIYLSRDSIKHIGSQHRLPCGFGSREQMLSNLLYAAIDHDMLGAVLQHLRQIVGDWIEFYTSIHSNYPFTASYTTVWLNRLEHTGSLLQQLEGAINDRSNTDT